MTKIDIFSGFLGAGKTTLIKKLVSEAYQGEKIVLIENEFGEIGIDGGFLKDAGIQINEMNSGCICCSLVGDFGNALRKVLTEFSPDRILIEPSGVGKLSDIITAVDNLGIEDVELNGFTTVVDAKKCKMYMKNFGEFFDNQVEHAGSIILSHTAGMSQDKLDEVVEMLRQHNKSANLITSDWNELDGRQILKGIEGKDTLKDEIVKLAKETAEHHHDEECDDPECSCHHHHEEHEHHHHEHEQHEHHHSHDHDHEHYHHEHAHDHHEHHHHHADEVFDSIGFETTHQYSEETIKAILDEFNDEQTYGTVLRAKGIVAGVDGKWIHFDYVPGESDVRTGSAGITGRVCVIGSGIKEDEVRAKF